MINRCIGCYYHDNKENFCTHGSPIFIDDTCTDYQDSEFVKQIRAEERAKMYEIINDIYDSIEYPNEDDAQWFNNIINKLEQ